VRCTQAHFQCQGCLTLWTSVMNQQRYENSDIWRARAGHISCKASGCTAERPYPRADMCRHLTDPQVLEGYLSSLESIDVLSAQEAYQSQLSQAVREARLEIEARYAGVALEPPLPSPLPDQTQAQAQAQAQAPPLLMPPSSASEKSASASTCNSGQSSARTPGSATAAPTRAELEALAESLRMQLPDARMCPQCSFGPIIKRACDDLGAHNGQDEGGGVRINNACPQCGWFGQSWGEWLPWNGYFSESLSQGAFKLGGADSAGGAGGASVPVVLAPEDARLQRLRLLEKAQEQTRLALEASQAAAKARSAVAASDAKRARTEAAPGPDLSKMTPEERDNYRLVQEQKARAAKAREDKLRKEKERELLKRQIKADHR